MRDRKTKHGQVVMGRMRIGRKVKNLRRLEFGKVIEEGESEFTEKAQYG